jgi:methylenetetrahydrofolate reductase (NADPH)
MANEARRFSVLNSDESLREVLMRLAHEASIELNVQDIPHLVASRAFLGSDTRIYVSHLPKQSFEQTLEACSAVRAVGFEPIPHVPVRLLESQEELSQLIDEAAARSVKELLLISGDYPHALGPYSAVADVLKAMDLRARGIERISIGGHPEGHAKVGLSDIRQAELDKARIANGQGLKTTFVTQFFFESKPFLEWAGTLRRNGANAAIRAGLAGPAKLSTLLRFAVRCGVGPSIRALGTRPGAFAKLLGEHGPENLLAELADSAIQRPEAFQGLHMFCFGGYLRTCRWLHAVASGHFKLNAGELTVQG